MADNIDWHKKVYRKNKEYDYDYWARVREIIITRDHLRCKSCFKRKLFKNLSVHHIIPRSEGGCDDMDNLITLCVPCHDAIEETDIRTASEIYGYMTPEKRHMRAEAKISKSRDQEEILKRIDSQRPSWHARVYGGSK